MVTDSRTFTIDFSLPDSIPTTTHPLQNDDYTFEVLVVGTALTECACSCIMQLRGLNILHIDDKDFYGRINASLSLKQIYETQNREIPSVLSQDTENIHSWHIDTFPKVVMPDGVDYNLIIKAGMVEYFQFFPLSGLVFHENRVKGLPLTFKKAFSSGLISWTQILSFSSFIKKISSYEESNPSTVFFNETDSTIDVLKSAGFTKSDQISWASYAFALHADESELRKPAKDTILSIKRYIRSCIMLQSHAKDGISPFMYISYGSGEFCQGCARKASVYGGTYRLKCELKEILFDSNGHVSGAIFHDKMIENKDIEIKCKAIVLDPELAPKYCVAGGTIIRNVLISKTPIPTTEGKSCQIIIPPDPTAGKISVTYICQLSNVNNVCPPGYYIIVISTRKDFLSDSTNKKRSVFGK